MTLPLWLLVPGFVFALLGAVLVGMVIAAVVADIAWMIGRRRGRR